jgi:hypothetical protein
MSLSTSGLTTFIKKNPIGVSCALVSVLLLGLLYFRSDRGEELQTLLDQKTAEASKLAANVKNSAQLKEQYERVLTAKTEIETRLMRADELLMNQQYFYKLESDSGVKLLDNPRQSSGAKKDAKNAYQATAFSLNVQGDYKQLLTFLRRLENGTRYCRVLSATCNSSPERGTMLVMSLNLELLGFP